MSEKTKLMEQFRTLIFESIDRYTRGSKQINLDSDTAQHNLATFITGHLSPFINECEDEINSLQFMLDEFQNSQAALGSKEFKNDLESTINMHIARLKMMQNSKGEA